MSETSNEPDWVRVELPSGAIARVTVEGAKDARLLEALDKMMVAIAKQYATNKPPIEAIDGGRIGC